MIIVPLALSDQLRTGTAGGRHLFGLIKFSPELQKEFIPPRMFSHSVAVVGHTQVIALMMSGLPGGGHFITETVLLVVGRPPYQKLPYLLICLFSWEITGFSLRRGRMDVCHVSLGCPSSQPDGRSKARVPFVAPSTVPDTERSPPAIQLQI